MALYTPESRERVRDAIDFVELVSAHTELRRAGPHNYEGLCPFHDERSPSFGIEPERKVYYCFGCQASGDVFTFVQQTEGVDFRGALELLAQRLGIELELEEEDPRERERRGQRERLLALLARTADFYERCLWESTEAEGAREYLKARGLEQETLCRFRVGYAPSGWDRVLVASRQAGFTDTELLASGLAHRDTQAERICDRFRGRIMFPLADVRGHVLGFGARATRTDQRPKYLNSAENEVYHKGRHLFGADLARAHVTRAGRVVLCEGYTDVIALHQAGLENSVGLMGTALTEAQVGELARMAQIVLLALDADSAGHEAMLRAARAAAQRKLEMRVVPLPPGSDPAAIVQSGGAEAIDAAIAASVPFVRYRVERILDSGEQASPEGRDRTIEQLQPVLATLPPSALRLELTRIIAGRLDLPESVAADLLGEHAPSRPAQRGGGGERSTSSASALFERREEAERSFLALCIALPDHGATTLKSLGLAEHFTGELLRRAAQRLRDGDLRNPLAGASEAEDPELARTIAALIVQAGRETPTPASLEVQHQQLRLASVERRLREANARGEDTVPALAIQRAAVKRAFDEAYAAALGDLAP
jgi:DNA primase